MQCSVSKDSRSLFIPWKMFQNELYSEKYLQDVRQKELPGVKVNCVHHANPQIDHQRVLMPVGKCRIPFIS